MNKLSKDKQIRIVAALVEGNSIRATVRMTGVAKNTVVKLLVDLGAACQKYHDSTVRGLKCQRIQVDEIWSFVGCKRNTALAGGKGDGDCWTWVGIDADSKLVVSYLVGLRDSGYATEFMRDIASRLVNRVQLSSDGNTKYLNAVEDAFGPDGVDYAKIEKIYGKPEGNKPEQRYSPPTCIGTRKVARFGNPDPAHISTSYVERQNLTIRMSNRRFTRLTNAFSKKWENHAHSIALYFMHYNFCRIHQSLRITPAMAAGVSKTCWEISDLLGLLDGVEPG